MNELIPDSKYKIMLDNIYLKKRLEIDEYLNKEKDLVITNELGKGFIFILDLYTKSDIILSFYAQKFIADILKDIDFAKMVHTKYRTDVINNLDLNSYIINLLKIYDASLASYVSKHLEVLSFLNINNALENHSFEEEPERYNLMFAKVHEYLVNKDSLITEIELLSFIGNELGIIEEISKYAKISKQMLTNILNNLSNYFDTDNISLIDKVHYNNVKKIMINALFSQSISHEKSICYYSQLK